MLKSFVTILIVASIVNAAHVDKKRFFGSSFGEITNSLGINLDLSALTNFQNTISQLTSSLSTSLESLINGETNNVAFIQQLVGNLNTLGTEFPTQVLSNNLISMPIDTCVSTIFNPSGANADTCLAQIFPQIDQCTIAIQTPTLINLVTCTKLLEGVSKQAQACASYVQNKDEASFIECSKLVANMISPKAATLLSIYQQCKPISNTADYNTISSCAFDVLNAANSNLGSTYPVLSQISSLQPLANCVYANHQTTTSMLQNCQSQLSSALQSFNLNTLSSIITQLTQCKSSGSSVKDCATKLIQLSKSF